MNRRDEGSVVVEAALMFSVIGLLVVALVVIGRADFAKNDVRAAAEQAARAATRQATPGAAAVAARTTATTNLETAGIGCDPTSLNVTTSLGAFAPGDTISVTVICTVSRGAPVPINQTYTATAFEVIDEYRSS